MISLARIAEELTPERGGVMGASKLRSADRVLLDLLCLAAPMAAELDRAFRLKPGWGDSIDALRNKGLVAFDSLRPSSSALADFADRRNDTNDTNDTNRIGGGSAPVVEEEVLRIPAAGGPKGCTSGAAGEALEPAGAGARLPELRRGGNNGRWPQWTPDEDERLRRAYAAGERIDLLAVELGRGVRGTMSRARKIGLAGRHAAGRGGFVVDPDWALADEQQLRELYGTLKPCQIAAVLGRSQSSVYNRAFQLGLTQQREWSDEHRRALAVAHDRGLALADAAIAIGRKYAAIAKYAVNHDLRFGTRPRLARPITLSELLALADPATPVPATVAAPRPQGRTPRKWPPAQIDLLLETLERTGKVAVAAAAIGRSKGAIYQLRKGDAAFAERWDAALRRSPYAPGVPAGSRPQAWDSLERQDRFVEALRRVGKIRHALTEIGLSPDGCGRVAEVRRRNPDFDERCSLAIAAARASRRAAERRPRAKKAKAPTPPAPAAEKAPRFCAPPPLALPSLANRPGGILTRAGAAFADTFRAQPPAPPRRYKSDAEISAETLRFLEERKRMESLLASESSLVSVDDAKLRLQRRGRTVCRASIHGGSPDLWYVSGLGKEVTDEQLVAAAQRVNA